MTTFRTFLFAGASAMTLLATMPADATTYTIDFTILPLYTPVTGGPDLTISLGGFGSNYGTTPVTGPFGYAGLANSTSGYYPTAEYIDFAFSTAVTNVSFTFNNFGDGSGPGHGASFFQTSAGGAGYLGNLTGSYGSFILVSVPGTFNDLKIDNGCNSSGCNWEFGVGQITYTTTTTVPEPATWALIMSGFGGVALLAYLRRQRPVARAA